MDTVNFPELALDRAALDRARLSRDARFDGRFFIAVGSTGVYCRPVCPTRSPKAGNVRYYPTAAAAAEAGFRPCLRCRPEAAPMSPGWLGVSAVVRRALRLIEQGALDDGSVPDLAERLGIGPRHLRRLFVEHVGASPLAVAQTRRLHFAKRLIDETDLPMTAVALEAGYGSLRRFNAVMREAFRRSPGELRRARRRRRADRLHTPAKGIVLRLAYRPPYDWAGIRSFLARRAIPEIEDVDGTSYARSIVQDSKPALIVIRSPIGADVIELELRGAPGGGLYSLVCRVRRMFDLAVDPLRIESAFRRDPFLGPLVARYPGLRIPGAWDPFECCVRALLGQASIMRERRLVSRLVRSCGARITPAIASGQSVTHLFPTVQAVAVGNLAGIGLAGPQVAALRALAAAFIERRLDFEAPSEELLPVLNSLPGIDENIAQYIVLRALGDPDAFPIVSPDVRTRAGCDNRRLGSSLAERSRAWRPWRGYAAAYLWRAALDTRPDVTEGHRACAQSSRVTAKSC